MENTDGSSHLYTYVVLLTVPIFKFCWLAYHPALVCWMYLRQCSRRQRRMAPFPLAAATAAVLRMFQCFFT